jgi:hypothetical protein
MGRRVCRSGTVRRAYAGKSDQRGNKGAIRGHTRRASSTGSFGAVRGGRRTRQGDARQRWTGAVQHAKRLYPRIETAHIAISRCMRVNLTTGVKRRGDERDTATIYDILFLHLMPSFRGLGLVYPAWLIPMVLRDLSKVYLTRNNERHAPINQFFSFSETDGEGGQRTA